MRIPARTSMRSSESRLLHAKPGARSGQDEELDCVGGSDARRIVGVTADELSVDARAGDQLRIETGLDEGVAVETQLARAVEHARSRAAGRLVCSDETRRRE